MAPSWFVGEPVVIHRLSTGITNDLGVPTELRNDVIVDDVLVAWTDPTDETRTLSGPDGEIGIVLHFPPGTAVSADDQYTVRGLLFEAAGPPPNPSETVFSTGPGFFAPVNRIPTPAIRRA